MRRLQINALVLQKVILLNLSIVITAVCNANAKTDGEENPIAIVSNSSEQYLVWKAKSWEVQADNKLINQIRSNGLNNAYSLPSKELAQINRCFENTECKEDISLKESKLLEPNDAQRNARNQDRVLRRLSKDLFVAYRYGHPNMAVIIHAPSGAMVPMPKGATAMTIDAMRKKIFWAQCASKDYECELYISDLGETTKHLAGKSKFRIDDLQWKNGSIYAIGKLPSKKSHLGSSIFAWAGHPATYEDWFVLEFNENFLQTSKASIVGDLKNGYGFFPYKWNEQ